MKGHVEADERVDALHHEADSDTEEGMEFRVKGFSPRALRQDFTIEAPEIFFYQRRLTALIMGQVNGEPGLHKLREF